MMYRILDSAWLYAFLSNFKWYRKYIGGRWEMYYVEICGSFIWHHRPKATDASERPEGCKGSPTVEIWPTRPDAQRSELTPHA